MQMSNQMIMNGGGGGDIMRINRERFAAALARMDLNGNQLAAKAGVSRGTVTAVKTGKSCSPETAEKLAAVLGREIIEKEANK